MCEMYRIKVSCLIPFTQREMRSSVVLLLSSLLFCFVVEVHSQTYPFVRFGSYVAALSNHSYVDLTTVGDSDDGSSNLQCVTDLDTCCRSAQGIDRGDWYFPNGTRLQFSTSNNDIYERREPQRVDLRRRNNGVANGIYQCTIETNAVNSHDSSDVMTREIVYVGLYASGGEIRMYVLCILLLAL